MQFKNKQWPILLAYMFGGYLLSPSQSNGSVYVGDINKPSISANSITPSLTGSLTDVANYIASLAGDEGDKVGYFSAQHGVTGVNYSTTTMDCCFDPKTQEIGVMYKVDHSENVEITYSGVNAVKHLPVWSNYSTASTSAKNEWDKFFSYVDAHETAHFSVFTDQFLTHDVLDPIFEALQLEVESDCYKLEDAELADAEVEIAVDALLNTAQAIAAEQESALQDAAHPNMPYYVIDKTQDHP